MNVSYDLTTPVGQVRLMIGDTDSANLLFLDEEVAAFLTVESDSIRRGAALALETIASSEALISKKITTQDLQTDGPAVAQSLMASARRLRDEAARVEGESALLPTFAFPPAPAWADLDL